MARAEERGDELLCVYVVLGFLSILISFWVSWGLSYPLDFSPALLFIIALPNALLSFCPPYFVCKAAGRLLSAFDAVVLIISCDVSK